MQVLWLRLTPPLVPATGPAEIIVTGIAARVRSAIPIQPAGS